MSPKELLYIKDSLSHEKHMKLKCDSYAQKIQDAELRSFVEGLSSKHQRCFGQFYQLLNQ